MIKKLLIFAVLSSFLLMSCKTDDGKNDTNNDKAIDENTLGLSETALLSDDVNIGEMKKYSEAAAGTSQMSERSFENAPPMIPHSVQGFLPIKIDANQCLMCHMPDKAEAMKATAIPHSHFINYRPGIKETDGMYSVDAKNNEVVNKDLAGKLDHARFNCTLCHSPQTDAKLNVTNTFKAEFRNEGDKKKSNLDKNIGEGVK